MGAIVALFHKKGEDATETVLTMLKTMKAQSIEAYGIGSAKNEEMKKTLDQFRSERIKSSIIVGYVFARILKNDKPQPLKLADAALVFDGRIFPANERNSDAEVAAARLSRNREESAKKLIRWTEGDFAFAVAEPERIIAGRDSLGLRPLYYGENAFSAGLASERKALWNVGIECARSFCPGHVAIVNGNGFKFSPARTLHYSKPKKTAMEAASTRLGVLLEKAVRDRVNGLKQVAVAFSGGLDSTILAYLAKKSGLDVELVHVSLKNRPEIEHAKMVADDLRLPIHSVSFSENDVLKALPSVLCLIEEPDPVKASIGIPFYWAAQKTAEMKLKVMLAGQGADELFAGYRRYVDAYLENGSEKSRELIFKDILEMHKSNFERDYKICNFHGVEMRLPFATYKMAKFAVDLPMELKIQPKSTTLRKLVLRNLARSIGLPRIIVDKPKKAVQYSTGVSRALEKIAKQKRRSLKDYLQETFQATVKKMMQSD